MLGEKERAMVAVKIKLPIEEYLEVERQGETRLEYHQGILHTMAGGTINHSTLCNNTGFLLNSAVFGGGNTCRAFTSEVKIEIEKAERYVYPDAAVVCEAVEESDTIKGAIRNPKLVVEVISDTSADYDRGAKMRYYLSLPSVMKYLLIEQDRPAVSLYRRQDKGNLGRFHYADGLESSIELLTLGTHLALRDLYRDVEFPPTDEVVTIP